MRRAGSIARSQEKYEEDRRVDIYYVLKSVDSSILAKKDQGGGGRWRGEASGQS